MIIIYEARLKELGLSLPDVPKPVATYVPAVRTGRYVFTSGQIPLVDGELKYKGRIGADLTEEDGRQAAKVCAVNCLAAIRQLTGSLDEIQRIVKVTGFVSSAPGFVGQPRVINGASDFLGELFGEAGKHARSAVGVSALPLDAAVEIEMLAEIK